MRKVEESSKKECSKPVLRLRAVAQRSDLRLCGVDLPGMSKAWISSQPCQKNKQTNTKPTGCRMLGNEACVLTASAQLTLLGPLYEENRDPFSLCHLGFKTKLQVFLVLRFHLLCPVSPPFTQKAFIRANLPQTPLAPDVPGLCSDCSMCL